MKAKKFNYILFVFVQTKRQEKFTKEIAEEIVILTKSDFIRYYFGDTACIYTFKTDEDLKSVSEFVDIILSEGKINYFLLPYNDGQVVYGLDEEVSNHLFGNEPAKNDDEIVDDINKKIKESFEAFDNNLDKLKNDFGHFFNDMDNLLDEFDPDDDEISKLIKKSKQPKSDNYVSEETFNSLLDKISIYGMEGLSEKELSLMDKYSKQIK
jgi:hypothetical protein